MATVSASNMTYNTRSTSEINQMLAMGTKMRSTANNVNLSAASRMTMQQQMSEIRVEINSLRNNRVTDEEEDDNNMDSRSAQQMIESARQSILKYASESRAAQATDAITYETAFGLL